MKAVSSVSTNFFIFMPSVEMGSFQDWCIAQALGDCVVALEALCEVVVECRKTAEQPMTALAGVVLGMVVVSSLFWLLCIEIKAFLCAMSSKIILNNARFSLGWQAIDKFVQETVNSSGESLLSCGC